MERKIVLRENNKFFIFILLDICNHQLCKQMKLGWVTVFTVAIGTNGPY